MTLLEQLQDLRARKFPGYDAAIARQRAARLAQGAAFAEAQAADEAVRQFGSAPVGLDFAIAEVRDAIALVTEAEAQAALETIR